mgnify:FL=1
MQFNIKSLARKVFHYLSKKAILDAKGEDKKFLEIWNLSLKIIPDSVLDEHFIVPVFNDEVRLRIRLLICGEVYFAAKVIEELFGGEKKCTFLDIGDSDGSTRLLLNEALPHFSIDTMGINLQLKAVEKIRRKGLKAECLDAMEVQKAGTRYDIVSLFETLEHLTNPIGFLENIHETVKHRLIISVPLICHSRISLRYLDKTWDKNIIPTIENTHIFELAPEDWRKIFLHTGWRVESEWRLRQFPDSGILKIIMQRAWRKLSFEGFWFAALTKDMFHKNRFMLQ